MIRRLLVLALLVPSLCWAVCVGTDNYSTTVCADSPTFYWRMHASSGTTETAFAGSTDGTYAGTFTLSQTGIPALTDKAVSFNGSSGTRMSIAVGSSSSAGPSVVNGQGWSAEVWANFAALTDPGGGGPSPLSRYGQASLYQWDLLHLTSDGKIRAQWWKGGSSDCGGVSATNIIASASTSTSTWYHLVITTIGNGTQVGTAHFYINGTDQGTASNFNVCKNTDVGSSLNIMAANSNDDGLAMNGTIDEVAIYTSELTSAQVAAHYNCGSAGTSCTGVTGSAGFPFSVKRELKPWSPKEWFVALR